MDDYDADAPVAVMTDFCAAAISSMSQFASVAGAVRLTQEKLGPGAGTLLTNIIKLITFDATAYGGTTKAAPNLNTLIRYGSPSALALANTYDTAMVAAMRNEKVNAHLRYTDSAANGYGVAMFDGDAAT